MPTILPEGDAIRKATRWASQERQQQPDKNINVIVEEACLRFNLSPKDSAFLSRFLKGEIT